MAYTPRPKNRNLQGLLARLTGGNEIMVLHGDSQAITTAARLVSGMVQEWPANWSGLCIPGHTNSTGPVQAAAFNQTNVTANRRLASDATPGQIVTGGLVGAAPFRDAAEWTGTGLASASNNQLGDYGMNKDAPPANPLPGDPWWWQAVNMRMLYAIGGSGTHVQAIDFSPRRYDEGNLAFVGFGIDSVLSTEEGFHFAQTTVAANVNGGTGEPFVRVRCLNTGSPDHMNCCGWTLSVRDVNKRKAGFCLASISESGSNTDHHTLAAGSGGRWSDAAIEAVYGMAFPSSVDETQSDPVSLIAIMLGHNTTGTQQSDLGTVKTDLEALRTRLLARATAVGASPDILWIAPWMNPGEAVAGITEAYRDAMDDIAKETGDMFISLYDRYLGQLPDEIDASYGFTDTLHPDDDATARLVAADVWYEIAHPAAGGGARGRRVTLGIY